MPPYHNTLSAFLGVGTFLQQLDQKNFPPVPEDHRNMTLKHFTGRKFRDVEETCESLDTSTEKTSNE
jgi:hypothetical protein